MIKILDDANEWKLPERHERPVEFGVAWSGNETENAGRLEVPALQITGIIKSGTNIARKIGGLRKSGTVAVRDLLFFEEIRRTDAVERIPQKTIGNISTPSTSGKGSLAVCDEKATASDSPRIRSATEHRLSRPRDSAVNHRPGKFCFKTESFDVPAFLKK